MMGILSLEVYNSIFNKTEQINKFEIYLDNFDEFSFEELKDELWRFLDSQILHRLIYNMK